MEKNDMKKFLATFGSILVLLSMSGCTLSFSVDKAFSDEVISSKQDEIDLRDISKVYKEAFFSNLPLIRKDAEEKIDKKQLKKVFSNFYVDYDYDSAYLFLNEYIKYLKSINDNNVVLNNTAIFKKDNEYSNSAVIEYEKDNKIYSMNIYEKDYILDFYENVNQKCTSDNVTFIKDFTYSFNKLPGDKSAKKDKASWCYEYELDLNNKNDIYKIVISCNSLINVKKDSINTLEDNKRILIYHNGGLLFEKDINDKEFNKYVTEIYRIYTNDLKYSELSIDDSNVLKLIKKHDN